MNRLEYHGSTSSFHGCFGQVTDVRPLGHVRGLGHSERIRLSFNGGLSLELSQAVAIDLARRLPEAINALPQIPDCAGEVWRGESA